MPELYSTKIDWLDKELFLAPPQGENLLGVALSVATCAHQLSAVEPIRSRIPDSSPEITALPSRKSQPVAVLPVAFDPCELAGFGIHLVDFGRTRASASRLNMMSRCTSSHFRPVPASLGELRNRSSQVCASAVRLSR
jgi:hypothetical protein